MSSRHPAGSPASTGGQFAPAGSVGPAASLGAQPVPTALDRRSPFAEVHSLADIEDTYEYATEPELLWRDGEATPAEVKETLRKLERDRAVRAQELRAAGRL